MTRDPAVAAAGCIAATDVSDLTGRSGLAPGAGSWH